MNAIPWYSFLEFVEFVVFWTIISSLSRCHQNFKITHTNRSAAQYLYSGLELLIEHSLAYSSFYGNLVINFLTNRRLLQFIREHFDYNHHFTPKFLEAIDYLSLNLFLQSDCSVQEVS